ncbi:hypothetical protein N0V82_006278 [Gnomoniopsis sp. IMI 355080]|nr:hypothetical protein N0V82_006278 [Gnomoniopsis sp. IMI 355080]
MMLHGSGSLRGALSLDVIVTLAYELKIQFKEEELREGSVYDPARELARAGREPMIRCLENIREQLAKSIAKGDPSLKRYVMVSALVSKLKALEFGGNVRDAYFDAVRDAVHVCTMSLETYLAQHAPKSGGVNDTAAPLGNGADLDLNPDTMSFEALMNPLLLFKCSEF